MKLEQFRRDETKQTEGVWLAFDDETQFLIADLNNRKFVKSTQKRIRKVNQNALRDDVDLQNRITIEAMADAILLGWKGVTENGQDVPYSKERAVKLLTEIPDLRNWVSEQAGNLENFRKEIVAAQQGELKSEAPVAAEIQA